MRNNGVASDSAFAELGLHDTIRRLCEEVQALYVEDQVPWIIGYSGGKDSTATLQLIWMALQQLPAERRQKPIHVISTDTLVENPVVAGWVASSLACMEKAAHAQGLGVHPHRLVPELQDTFWVNLIGKGYPAPRHKFRWCTERLKIKPSNRFIGQLTRKHGSSILVLGIRKKESAKRKSVMKKLERGRLRERLSPNANLPNCQVYSPLEDWTNDDVWLFLMQYTNPWGFNNKDLLTMYQGASPDGECPLVVDSSTPSCGSSRFGCWVCTLVDKDRSMQAMIQNDREKEWMLPLLEIRNALDVPDDRPLRDFRRMNGAVQLFNDRVIPGPYTQKSRERWLRMVLEAQRFIQNDGPAEAASVDLISLDELREIRRIWVTEKHELEDSLPRIYEEALGKPFPDQDLDDARIFGPEEIEILLASCGEDRLHFELVRELIGVAWEYRAQVRRAGLFDRLEKAIRKGLYEGEEDATATAIARRDEVEKELQLALDPHAALSLTGNGGEP